MPPQRKKKGASATAAAYPTGPVLLGELIRAANILNESAKNSVDDDPDRRSRSEYRALAGDVVEEGVLIDLCVELSRALVDKDVVPSDGVKDAKALVMGALYCLVRQWDAATMEQRVGSTLTLDGRVMALAAAQLLAIDLAVRVGSWMSILGSHIGIAAGPAPQMADTMNRALRSAKRPQPELARELGIAETTLYRWRIGRTRPTDANLDQLAERLACTPGASSIGDVRRQLTVAAILDTVGRGLEPSDVDDLWQMFVRTANRTAEFLNTRPPDELAKNLRRDLVLRGPQSELAADVLDRLRDQESEFRWHAPLDSVSNWDRRLDYARGIAWRFARERTEGVIAEPGRTLLINFMLAEASAAIDQFISIWSDKQPELATVFQCYGHLAHAAIARRRGDLPELVRRMRAAEAMSCESDVAGRVVASLIEAGELDAAIGHAATGGAETATEDARMIWAAKQIADGRILDGREELERLAAEGSASGELMLYLGTARWRCDDYVGALEVLEQVLELPEFEHHALALDIAAECAFRVGQQKRGAAFARRANRLGVWRTYLRWLIFQFSEIPTGFTDQST